MPNLNNQKEISKTMYNANADAKGNSNYNNLKMLLLFYYI